MADGLARAGFDIDLADGLIDEQFVARLLLKTRMEVKTDHQAHRTGNVFIEYQGPSGKSGIDTTTSDWWSSNIVLPNGGRSVVTIETRRLQALALETLMRQGGKPVRGGDYNKYLGVLISIDKLVRG